MLWLELMTKYRHMNARHPSTFENIAAWRCDSEPGTAAPGRLVYDAHHCLSRIKDDCWAGYRYDR